MSLVYHQKTCYSDYSKHTPPPKKKKKKQGGRSSSPSSNRYYYQTNAKTFNPLSKRFYFYDPEGRSY